ncbi:MAG: DoxX family membrane protein, partial [Nitrospinaceae bacterium]|nr:DoxX family protein [Nitrospinaceae bacterium]NIR56320.1 DoxX family protein [Nitrospinaceae bacterium]NIS86777.1 DoxX family protein [Nitrospinaceae bacterium]NIT83612.1 DoxX family protein [Nitrospinaceae bacterium]NIU45814.1 DoxX family protein [Nitrospinaceae bacterium]
SQKLFGMFDGPGIAGFMGYLQKLGVPNPEVSAYLAGGVEFFCGGAVLLGLWARLATIPLIINMGVAVALVH